MSVIDPVASFWTFMIMFMFSPCAVSGIGWIVSSDCAFATVSVVVAFADS